MKIIVAVLVIMLVFACVFGFFVFVDDVAARSINQREWLLEFEGVVIDPYPAPFVVTLVNPYPVPPTDESPKSIISVDSPTKTEDSISLFMVTPTPAPTMDVLLPYPAPPTYEPPYPAPPYPAPPTYEPPYPAPPTYEPPYPAPPTYEPPYPAP